jgi:hypothetical protein
MAGGGGSPRLYQKLIFLTADFGFWLCHKKMVRAQNLCQYFVGEEVTPGT